MGVCGSASFGKLKDNSARFDIEPADTESLKGQSLPTLAFYILLSDLKIKKCSYDYIGLRFKIEGIHNEECAVKEVDRQQRVYWKLYKTFEFMTNEYELRRKFLEIEAYNLKKQVIGSLKINLYMIWTGPYHLDFKLPLKQCKTCRISFNFKMSQGISFKLQDLKTEFLPNEVKVEGQRFTFTLSAIIGQKTEPSSYAYNIVVGQNKNQAKQHFQLSPTKYISKQKTIKWQNIDKFPQLPSFQQTVAYYQVYSSSLHLCFWRIQPGIQDPSILRYESEGECFISLNKLMTLDYTITKDPVTNINYVNRKVLLNQKIWLHGKELGSANIQFRYSLQAHQKQMQACVRTEQGILTSTPVFSGDNSQKLHECEQIVALKKLHTQIQKQFINLDQECERKNSFITKKEIVLRIYNLLERKLALIEKSHKESILFYSYQDESELIRAQRFLINFAFNILSYIHEDIMDLNNICWNILTAILRRGEFKLSHMCFSKEFKDELLNNKNSQKLREKSETCFKYLELMNELLKETLRALEIKGNENEQMFAENYCAYAYFRMPIFREHILQMIKSAKDPDIQEWRGSENNLYHDGSSQDLGVIDDFYDNLFDWESNFMRPLAQSNPARYKQNIDRFQVTLLEDRWKIRLAKRGGAFYTFLQNLVKEIEYVCVVSKHIRWHYLPGYNRLLQAFLVEMKFTKIREYSQRFKRCCVQILANQKLLNIFVVILLSRTNVNDPETVHDAFELIGQFFTFIKNKRRVIPSTFDYKYLMQGIKMVLNSELQFSIEKVLILLYDNFSFFSQQFSLELGLYIMANLFHKLFFHWSYNLRHIFHTILYTRILRIQYHKNESPTKTNGESNYITGLKVALKQYHEHLINTIKEEVDPNAFYSNADQFYQKDLFKKMKAKLKKKTLIRVHSSLLLNSKRQDLVPDHIAPSKSVGTNVKFIIPKKLLFFKQEELLPKPVKKEYTAYAKVALEEYKETVQNIKNRQKSDPNYAPQMRVKKILDQIQLKPLTSQEW